MNKNYITTLSKNGIKIEKRLPTCYKTLATNIAIVGFLLVLGGVLMSIGNGNTKNYCDYSVYPMHRGELNCIFY
jgi:hypothetical protein